MPLVTYAVSALIAGLLIGSLAGGDPLPAAVLAAACAVVGIARRRRVLCALAALVAAGWSIAWTDLDARTRCRMRALAGTEWRARLDDDASPGAYLPAELEDADCTVPATIAVTRGVARAGDFVRLRGDASAAPRGVRIAHAEITRDRGHSALLGLRAAAGTRIDALFDEDAPLVRALLIADQRAIDPALRDRFAAAGLVHMLSISGLHVAIIAAAVRLGCLALRMRPHWASGATIGLVALYVAMIGVPAPALRSAVMLSVAACARLIQRPTSAWGLLAIGAAAPLVSPRTVTDLGYQLSVLGMASLLAGGALTKRWIAPRWSGWRATMASLAVISSVATLASAPLVAWTFGRVSLVAPATNIVAAPVIGLLQPMLFLALLLAPCPAAARLVADAARPLLALFGAIADAGAAVPGASIAVAPSLVTALLAGVAAAAMLVACASRSPARPGAVALAALAAALWLPDVLTPPRGMELHVIDVGQGDAIAIRTPRGRWIVTDAGRAWPGGDAGRTTVVPYLRRFGGRVALFVLTHPHADHAGGAATLLRLLQPDAYWDAAFAGTSEPYRVSLEAAERSRVPWHRARPGDSLEVDGVVLRVLAPDSAWVAGLSDANEASVVTRVDYGAVHVVLTGDAERGEEERLVARYGVALRAAVLKVGHHGSRTSSTALLLAAVRPRLAIISVGAGNSYGHPDPEVLHALTRAGAAVLRTDELGSIVVRSDGRSLEVEAGGERWTVAAPSP